ncbi:T9SS type A sorting domain-containing protein [Hymenobacter sp. BT683]|uniref:T9SS type A sorting domain-containing protein n=1 Tax=Hymenobacter jeongseonensis TaxID=2791027 RepID=A0ABS0ID53_9BACT|nr:T9SS type A sorting domain-containing protein [Hymenobacter jeongseonensis]MBF9236286.1 T9SS type A sorting domain-containing protein [Hymenobacter jeongseonensis]
MKLFTRCTVLLTVLIMPLAPVLANIVHVAMGKNFYAPMAVTAHSGIQQNAGWQDVGQPTVSAATHSALTSELNVYPNPSRGQITVQLTQKSGIDYKLRLSNIIGQELRIIALKPELTSAGLPVDISDLRAGMYFYSLLADGKVVATKRLVLQD